jgi:predicted nucleic acid-binding protein
VVCDAGPLIHLDEVDSLDLLADFAEVLVPDAVWREVEQH